MLRSVHYRAGQAGFSLARPRLYPGQGGYVLGNPRSTPVWGPAPLSPGTGPTLIPLIFNRNLSGVSVGLGPERGQGPAMLKKKPGPRPLSGPGRGNGLGAHIFRGPIHPVTNSKAAYYHVIDH